jgi:hypothetical protein
MSCPVLRIEKLSSLQGSLRYNLYLPHLRILFGRRQVPTKEKKIGLKYSLKCFLFYPLFLFILEKVE